MGARTLLTLVTVQAEALLLAALFVSSGRSILRRWFLPKSPRERSLFLTSGRTFFVGMAAFQVLFVLGSALTHNARLGLSFSVGILLGISFLDLRRQRDASPRTRAAISAGLTLLGLVVVFTLTNGTAWWEWDGNGSSGSPGLLNHVGSIHSGRYANYSIVISKLNRIPHVAQNLGQSLLASVPLLLGTEAPLAGLTVWIPITLTALTALIYGSLVEYGVSRARATLGTFSILFCNVAVSAVPVALLDNGFPLGVIGYTDAICSLGTFVLFASIVVDVRLHARRRPWHGALAGLLLGSFWAWSAPQNVVIAVAVAMSLALLWSLRAGKLPGPLRRLAPITAGIVLGAALGATRIGPFLPSTLAENVGVPVISPGTQARIRPYVTYVVQQWSNQHWVGLNGPVGVIGDPGLYDRAWAAGEGKGRVVALLSVLEIFERELWTSVRLYALLPLAAWLLWRRSRDTTFMGERSRALETWSEIAFVTFAIGYAAVFFMELGFHKWWLVRFLLPGTLSCLFCLVLALRPRPSSGKLGWLFLCPVLLTLPPLFELGAAFDHHWPAAGRLELLSRRLDALAQSRGPFTR